MLEFHVVSGRLGDASEGQNLERDQPTAIWEGPDDRDPGGRVYQLMKERDPSCEGVPSRLSIVLENAMETWDSKAETDGWAMLHGICGNLVKKKKRGKDRFLN